jgi:hypothetical protein
VLAAGVAGEDPHRVGDHRIDADTNRPARHTGEQPGDRLAQPGVLADAARRPTGGAVNYEHLSAAGQQGDADQLRRVALPAARPADKTHRGAVHADAVEYFRDRNRPRTDIDPSAVDDHRRVS